MPEKKSAQEKTGAIRSALLGAIDGATNALGEDRPAVWAGLRKLRKLVARPRRFASDLLENRRRPKSAYKGPGIPIAKAPASPEPKKAAPKRDAQQAITPEQALRHNGFCAVRGLFSPDECKELAARLHAHMGTDTKEWMGIDCVNRVPVIAEKLFDQRIHTAVRNALGGDIRFLQISDLQLNHDHLQWHRDSAYRGPSPTGALDWDESSAPYRVIKILIYLESENAGLAVLPWTHRAPYEMDAHAVSMAERAGRYTVLAANEQANRDLSTAEASLPLMWCANVGDALIFDERLYHCGRRMRDGRVVADPKGRKLTVSYTFGADNVHSTRFHSYFRYIRSDLSYRAMSEGLIDRLRSSGLALSAGYGNYFERAPREVRGVYLRDASTMDKVVQKLSDTRGIAGS